MSYNRLFLVLFLRFYTQGLLGTYAVILGVSSRGKSEKQWCHMLFFVECFHINSDVHIDREIGSIYNVSTLLLISSRIESQLRDL